MTPRSLALSTDAWFVEEVEDLGDALALRTPSNPDWHWGNLLALPDAPGPDDLERLERRFAEAVALSPEVVHATFVWDDPVGPTGALAPFEAAGYEVDRNTVRTAARADLGPPPPEPEGFALHAVRSEADWDAVLTVQTADPPEHESPDAFARFRERVMVRHRRRARGELRDGLEGGWYLATIDGRPAGAMGLYVLRGLGRFQDVQVAPAFRRRGVATRMVHDVARTGFRRHGAERLVIVADEGSAADGIYARLGFAAAERLVGVCNRDVRRRARTRGP